MDAELLMPLLSLLGLATAQKVRYQKDLVKSFMVNSKKDHAAIKAAVKLLRRVKKKCDFPDEALREEVTAFLKRHD